MAIIGIYKITNKINNKVYIGQSLNIFSRFESHVRVALADTNKGNNNLSKAFRKYGLKNFLFEVLEECEKSKLNEREIYWIAHYNSTNKDKGYNMSPGGNVIDHPGKLNEVQLKEIVDLLQNTEITVRDIAIKYDVGYDLIREINKGKGIWHRDYLEYPLRGERSKYNKWGRKKEANTPKKTYKIPVPSKKELIECFYNNNYNREKVAAVYNVSSNLIHKWCNNYGFGCKDKNKLKNLCECEILGSTKKPAFLHVAQIDPDSFKVIKIFNSLAAASKIVRADVSKLKKACLQEDLLSGYYWKIVDNNYHGSTIIIDKNKQYANIPSRKELLETFKQFNFYKREVANHYGITTTELSKWCNLHGFGDYAKDDISKLYDFEILGIVPKFPKSHGYDVKQINPDNHEVIQIFSSMEKAGRAVGGNGTCIKNACTKGKIAYGFYWELVDSTS